MPLFAYHCQSCETDSEVLVRNGEAVACPACGSNEVQKLMSAFAPAVSHRKQVAPAGCGAASCCQMQGGCGLN